MYFVRDMQMRASIFFKSLLVSAALSVKAEPCISLFLLYFRPASRDLWFLYNNTLYVART